MAWSQFFGSVKGRASTKAERVGNIDSGLQVLAASKTGAITVRLFHFDGKDRFEISLVEWGNSKFDQICLASGVFSAGEGPPVIHLHDGVVRQHVEAEALKVMIKEAR